MTRAALAHTGVRTEQRGEGSWWVEGRRPDPVDVTVEPDLSSAAVFLAAAAVTGGRVTVTGWPERTTQGGATTSAGSWSAWAPGASSTPTG